MHTTPNFEFDEAMFNKSVAPLIRVDLELFIDETLDITLLLGSTQYDIFIDIFR